MVQSQVENTDTTSGNGMMFEQRCRCSTLFLYIWGMLNKIQPQNKWENTVAALTQAEAAHSKGTGDKASTRSRD